MTHLRKPKKKHYRSKTKIDYRKLKCINYTGSGFPVFTHVLINEMNYDEIILDMVITLSFEKNTLR